MTDEKSTFYPAYGLEIGDTFTISGVYKRRSFFQWLRREAKELWQHKVTAKYTDGSAEIQK